MHHKTFQLYTQQCIHIWSCLVVSQLLWFEIYCANSNICFIHTTKFNSSKVVTNFSNTSSCTMMHFEANLSLLHKFITRQNNSNLRSWVMYKSCRWIFSSTVNDQTKIVKMYHCVVEIVLNIYDKCK